MQRMPRTPTAMQEMFIASKCSSSLSSEQGFCWIKHQIIDHGLDGLRLSTFFGIEVWSSEASEIPAAVNVILHRSGSLWHRQNNIVCHSVLNTQGLKRKGVTEYLVTRQSIARVHSLSATVESNMNFTFAVLFTILFTRIWNINHSMFVHLSFLANWEELTLIKDFKFSILVPTIWFLLELLVFVLVYLKRLPHFFNAVLATVFNSRVNKRILWRALERDILTKRLESM